MDKIVVRAHILIGEQYKLFCATTCEPRDLYIYIYIYIYIYELMDGNYDQ